MGRRGIAGRLTRAVLIAVGVIILVPYVAVRDTPLPPGVDIRGPWRTVEPGAARLLTDRTAWDPAREKRVIRQEIFDAALRMVEASAGLVCADFFLWNDWQGDPPERHRALSSEWAKALAERKAAEPDTGILMMTDPLNRLYGDVNPPAEQILADPKIPVVYFDPALLPDSNPVWSRPVRFFGPVFDRSPFLRRFADRPRLANPFEADGPRLSLRQAARLLHFKANHRKVLVTDTPEGTLQALVTSFNPADGSSAHGNSALRIEGAVAFDVLHGMLALADNVLNGAYAVPPEEAERLWSLMRRWETRYPRPAIAEPPPGHPRVRWLTEAAIARAIEERLDGLGPGDSADVAMFYLSDRRIIRRIRQAAERGATVRLILDPNRDAFGREKNGIPNRPVAAELMRSAPGRNGRLTVRWADTHGEQFHHKALFTATAAGDEALLLGSSNWTRRNLRNFNLETNFEIENEPDIGRAWRDFFETAWAHTDGLSRTRPHEAFAEPAFTTFWKTTVYRFQEWSGLCTF